MLNGKGSTPFGPTRAKVERRIPVRRQECLPVSALYPYPGVYEPKGEEGANRRGERPPQTTGGIQEWRRCGNERLVVGATWAWTWVPFDSVGLWFDGVGSS